MSDSNHGDTEGSLSLLHLATDLDGYGWYQSYPCGQKIWVLEPEKTEIFIPDLVKGLVQTIRWNGFSLRSISVAEHSLHVADMLPNNIQLFGLLHDAAEAYIFDAVRPIKKGIKIFGVPFEVIEDAWLKHIFNSLDISYSEYKKHGKAVKAADDALLKYEATLYTSNIDGWAEFKTGPSLSDRFKYICGRPVEWVFKDRLVDAIDGWLSRNGTEV